MKRNVLTVLLSIAIAFGLWLYVVTVISPNSDNTYHGVSVVLQGEAILEERGLMITTDQIPTVSLRLEGNRSELQKLNSSNISVTVDVSKIAEPGEHKLAISPSNIRLPGNVSYSAITVASRKPDYITLVVKQRVTKTVPVDVDFGDSRVLDGHIADTENIQLDYSEIQVSGPSDVVDQIAMAKIHVDLNDKSATFSESQPFTLCNAAEEPVDAKLITTNVGSVEFTLRILKVKQISLRVNVQEGGGATLQDADVNMDVDSILVSGTEAALQNLETITVGTVNLGDLPQDTALFFPINLPEGVGNETGISNVLVEVKFKDLDTKVMSITNIVAVNVPEGREPEIITKALEIQFRGPATLIETLQPEHVTVIVDFSDAQVGTATLRAVVTFTEEYAQIGAIGGYSVAATLK